MAESVYGKDAAAAVENLQNLTAIGDFQVIQVNGQRIFAPKPTAKVMPPPKGTEVFVGRLPKRVFEDRLLAVFSRYGPIYKIRLMLDFTGCNRGYAFVTFFTPESASLAIQHLDKYPINNCTITVTASLDNCRLFMGKIPPEINKADVKIQLRGLVEGIKDVIMYKDLFRPEYNRGYAFIEFVDHASAAIARRRLSLGNIELWNRKVNVDWAEPIPQMTKQVESMLTRLYISNIPLAISSKYLYNLVNSILQRNNTITKVFKQSHYAFVHFRTHSEAEQAFHRLNGLVVNGNTLLVEWARPREYSKAHQPHVFTKNVYLSVPPRIRKLRQEFSAEP